MSLFTLFTLAFSAEAGLNKWVDEKGQVHYGDRVPAQYLKKEHSQLNEQGIVIRTTKAQKTPEQLEAEERQRKKDAEEERKRLIEEQKKQLRDRVLLDTFTTEKDLLIARDTRIEAIDSQISLAETMIHNDEKALQKVKKRIKRIRDSGREPPENLLKSEDSISRQIENNLAFVEDKTNERAEILKTFKEDIIRYRQLVKERQKARHPDD